MRLNAGKCGMMATKKSLKFLKKSIDKLKFMCYNTGIKRETKEIKIMKKATEKIVNKYNEWVADGFIYTEWEDEDYDNATVYENVNGDVLVIQRDENDKIVDAWE